MTDWQLSRHIEAEALKQADWPSALLSQLVLQEPLLIPHEETLYTVIAELWNNALDHGVLALNSALKQSAEGFEAYYAEREKRLAELQEGHVTFLFSFHQVYPRSYLEIVVEDSGQGFVGESDDHLLPLSGRGLSLIRQLCDTVVHTCGESRIEVRVLT